MSRISPGTRPYSRRAIAVLETGDPDAYAEALAQLRIDTREGWEATLADDLDAYPGGEPRAGERYVPLRADAESLVRFLNDDALPMIET